MKSKERLIMTVANGFQKHRGKACAYCYNKGALPELVYSLVTRFARKHGGKSVFVVTDDYDTRAHIVEYVKRMTDADDDADALNGVSVKYITQAYIKPQYKYAHDFTIIVGINDDYQLVRKLTVESTFTLCLFTGNLMNKDFNDKVRTILPLIETADLDIAIRNDEIYSPVEEHRVGIFMNDKEKEAYDRYTDYINTSMSIFGDLSSIEKCKFGDKALGISAVDFRENVARENGWREDLDINVPFMAQINATYNPNCLHERAINFYTFARARRDLVTDAESKLAEIRHICELHKDKKILVVSKRGEFAAAVTKAVGENCGDYHDCLDNVVAVDDFGDVVLVKSGEFKGMPRKLGAQAQSSRNMRRFNEGRINVLSIKSSSDTRLQVTCDILIITSTLCEWVVDIKKRFPYVTFRGKPTVVYVLYCYGTIEEDRFNSKTATNVVNVIDESEHSFEYDENSNCVVL